MPEISIPVTGNDIATSWQFAQVAEWLEVADKTITKIGYPHKGLGAPALAGTNALDLLPRRRHRQQHMKRPSLRRRFVLLGMDSTKRCGWPWRILAGREGQSRMGSARSTVD